jgi:hypothetical protein
MRPVRGSGTLVPVKRWLIRVAVALVVVFALIQFVPYGRDHSNPPVVAEPKWDSPATRKLAQDACFDCHSNQTTWPWYSNVAPVSWLVYNDVKSGREELNFSEWSGQQGAGDILEVVRDGSMPPWYYKLLHPDARLGDAERAALIRGFQRTLGP